MDLVSVDESNAHVYRHLIQAYEAEFSSITHKEPNADGLYELDTQLVAGVFGYILYDDTIPVGICAIKQATRFEICEFYIIPARRRKGVGELFATLIWQHHPGEWEVKQINGADAATRFWRTIIAKFSNHQFTEERFHDPYWGPVTRQLFSCP